MAMGVRLDVKWPHIPQIHSTTSNHQQPPSHALWIIF